MKAKRIFAFTLAIALCAVCAGCGGGDKGNKKGDTMSVVEIAQSITTDVKDLPASEIVELNGENFANYAFIPQGEGMEGAASEGLIGSIAHSVVIVRVPAGGDADTVKDEIEKAADPRKWICVEAEKTIVKAHGDTVLLVMSFMDTADEIAKNFDSLWK